MVFYIFFHNLESSLLKLSSNFYLVSSSLFFLSCFLYLLLFVPFLYRQQAFRQPYSLSRVNIISSKPTITPVNIKAKFIVSSYFSYWDLIHCCSLAGALQYLTT